MKDRSLADVLLAHAETLGDATIRETAGSIDVEVLGTIAAVIAPAALEVRLRPAVASAALRTPDVEVSPRGPGWVRFEPADIDEFARDRALAWLASAIRLAGEGGPRD